MQTCRSDSRAGVSRSAFLGGLVLTAAAILLTGCGGGGGSGPSGGTPVTVTGRVLRAETGTAPNPAATVTIGGTTVTAGLDGTFSLSAASNATTATVSAQGSQPRTVNIALSTTAANNLGDIYLSDTGYTATVTGRVIASVSGSTQGVGGATVTIAGVSTTTATDGTFTLNGLPVDLGNVSGTFGKVSASGFEDKPITDVNLQFPLKAGNNPIGDLLIATPSGSTPLPPYTIKGLVQVSGVPAGSIGIQLQKVTGGVAVTVGSATTDASGNYTFWVAAGTYTVTATSGTSTQSVNVTLVRLDTPVTAPTINF